MANKLLYYLNENAEYPKEKMMYLTPKQTLMVHKKLCRHFGNMNVELKISPHKKGGSFCSYGWIMVGKRTTMGILCHEIAHAIAYYRGWKRGHNKYHRRAMKLVINYVRKKNYWNLAKTDMAVDLNNTDAVIDSIIADAKRMKEQQMSNQVVQAQAIMEVTND